MATRRPPEHESPTHDVMAIDAAAAHAERSAAVDVVRSVVDDEEGVLAACRIGAGAPRLGDGSAVARLFEKEELGEVALQLLRVCGFWHAGTLEQVELDERLQLLRAIADAAGVNDVVRSAAKVQLLKLGVDGRDAALVRIDGLGPWLELALQVDDSEARGIVAARLTDRYDAWRVSQTPLAQAPWIVDEALRVLHLNAAAAVMLLIANESVRAREEVLAILAHDRVHELRARWPSDGAQPVIDKELSKRARGDVAAAFEAFLATRTRR